MDRISPLATMFFIFSPPISAPLKKALQGSPADIMVFKHICTNRPIGILAIDEEKDIPARNKI
ncbi:MAG: hypothetical protein DYH02_01145 [Candidatus Omnitrophica bacterium COP1]|nr:hypothetical protein [Candidatus Omnitrophica bacterium COP1]